MLGQWAFRWFGFKGRRKCWTLLKLVSAQLNVKAKQFFQVCLFTVKCWAPLVLDDFVVIAMVFIKKNSL